MAKVYTIFTRLRSRILVFLTHNMALPLLRVIRRPRVFPYSKEELQQFPNGSLGKDLVDFLSVKQLKLLPHYAKHDIKHVLLQYDTTDDGEVCLQCFMLGNGHLSFPVAATVLYGVITMPEHWTKFKMAFGRGRNAIAIKDWKWFDILTEPTAVLIKKIHDQHNPV
jgi:ubiquinone biosynthesis protein Coq4